MLKTVPMEAISPFFFGVSNKIIPRQGEFGLWHPGWGREIANLFLQFARAPFCLILAGFKTSRATKEKTVKNEKSWFRSLPKSRLEFCWRNGPWHVAVYPAKTGKIVFLSSQWTTHGLLNNYMENCTYKAVNREDKRSRR